MKTSRSLMKTLKYRKVLSLPEALEATTTTKGSWAFMAGGTDLLVQIKEGKRPLQSVIDVKGILEIQEISASGDTLLIGALTPIRTLEISPLVQEKIPLLAQAASRLGSIQVRHRATVGGNLCNASPAADTAPALLSLEAKAIIHGRAGSRVLDLTEFFMGPGKTALGDGELLTHLRVPLVPAPRGTLYYKLSTRRAMDLAFVGVAVLVELDRDGQVSKARIALGAVAPTPIRVLSAEKLLEGNLLSPESARESAEEAARFCKPISDQRASAEYRREMVRQLCYQGLLGAYRQAISSQEATGR